MSSARVSITTQAITDLEKIGQDLLLRGDEAAVAVLSLVLYMRSEAVGQRAEFRCEIDESAGMAEVVELGSWSQKVPCE
jgi:hypothetical protein